MSREVSRERTRSRTCSPDSDKQKILNLDSSPGSSRKIGDDGVEDAINIPNFSKEVSLDSDEDPINVAVNKYLEIKPEQITGRLLAAPTVSSSNHPKNVSPKSILKRRIIQPDTNESSKCCHSLVNKIKNIADKTLHKNYKRDKSPNNKRKKEEQPIVQLNSSPGATRRQKFGAIKLGESDELSKNLSNDTINLNKNKSEHIYEDIEGISMRELEKSIQFSPEVLETLTCPLEEKFIENIKEHEIMENKSNASYDPSLVNEEDEEQKLRQNEHVMESLHKNADLEPKISENKIVASQIQKENEVFITDGDSEEPDIEDVIKNQLEEEFGHEVSPNITITEISDEVEHKISSDLANEQDLFTLEQTLNENILNNESKPDWSKLNSDHEYEVISKPPTKIVFTSLSSNENHVDIGDEPSSNILLERKRLQSTSDDEDLANIAFEERNDHSALEFQKEVEDRYFISTPSTVSRTECDISTSQVDSSALENLPLKRDSRTQADNESKLHQRFKEQKEKIRNQAGRLKSKIQNMKTRQFSLPDKSKFKLPQMPDRPKFSMPDKRKFSLPERPRFKKINISEKLSLGDRKKFTFSDRSKFTMPEMPKFKIPEKAKINFSSLGRKKEYRVNPVSIGSTDDVKNIVSVDFESKTYPRPLNRKKKSDPQVSSSPVLNRADTPPPIFNFVKLPLEKAIPAQYLDENTNESQGPREYGNKLSSTIYDNEENEFDISFNNRYDLKKIEADYDEENRRFHEAIKNEKRECKGENTSSLPDVSSTRPEYTHVINEINNDEFFVRPKGISRENIQVRQYLSNEIREAFKMPSNSLGIMDGNINDSRNLDEINGEEADPELYLEGEPSNSPSKEYIDNDDGYYTFPPVRPSRAKKNKKNIDSAAYNRLNDSYENSDIEQNKIQYERNGDNELKQLLESENLSFNSQTLPLVPKRQKKNQKLIMTPNSIGDLRDLNEPCINTWNDRENIDDIIVYRTEHKYVVQDLPIEISKQSPLPPRRLNRSRSSHGTSIVDDDRTSHGAESLTFDPNISTTDQGYEFYKDDGSESPGYATVEKYPPPRIRRSRSKTPPAPRRRKSHSSERKYFSVDRIVKEDFPDRPPRKKSSTSLLTLERFKRDPSGEEFSRYAEIDDHEISNTNKDLKSGEIISKMKDRPLPPPPRPPRGSKKSKSSENFFVNEHETVDLRKYCDNEANSSEKVDDEVIEIEVSTQTDPLPDDIDYELGMEENLDISISSSLKDIGEDEIINIRKSFPKLPETPRNSRPGSRSDKSLVPMDPKVQDLSKNNLGRTSPTVILVERRVSSPTRINEREVIVTEASLTVQPIDIDESKISEFPPLPRANNRTHATHSSIPHVPEEETALEKLRNAEQVVTDIQMDNLVTQKLQVRDLDVGRLNVSELQANKILVSDIEGMTLQVSELESKSGNISVSGIELSPSVIDEIVKKISQISRPVSREEQTQTDKQVLPPTEPKINVQTDTCPDEVNEATSPSECVNPPVRPPPPDLSPLLMSYLQDLSIPPASFYQLRTHRERPFSDFYESQSPMAVPPPPTRRVNRRQPHHDGTSSDEEVKRRLPRRMPSSSRIHEPTITEAGAQFFRVCQNSISRALRNLFKSLMSYVNGNEDKKDVQMAMVIFLVLIAGLIMFGLSDGRTVHHHHWEFFNPPDGNIK